MLRSIVISQHGKHFSHSCRKLPTTLFGRRNCGVSIPQPLLSSVSFVRYLHIPLFCCTGCHYGTTYVTRRTFALGFFLPFFFYLPTSFVREVARLRFAFLRYRSRSPPPPPNSPSQTHLVALLPTSPPLNPSTPQNHHAYLHIRMLVAMTLVLRWCWWQSVTYVPGMQ